MESDAKEDPAWPSEWATKFEGSPVVDLHASAGAAEQRWLGPDNEIHPTWSPLIRARLAYDGLRSSDLEVLAYQRTHFGRSDGGEAMLDISAYALPHIDANGLREHYLDERVARLGRMIAQYKPEVVVCYGIGHLPYFESLCGGSFDAYGFRWFGRTLCALAREPNPHARVSPPPEEWRDLGTRLRLRVDDRRSREDERRARDDQREII
jgi:hypothetical protein